MIAQSLARFANIERAANARVKETKKVREECLDAIYLHMRENDLRSIDIGEWRYIRVPDKYAKTPPCHWGAIHPVRDGVWVTCPVVQPERLHVEALARSEAAA